MIKAKPINNNKMPLPLAISLIALLSAVIVLWISPKNDGDLFVAVAGGKDILKGMLAAPDQWSFSTGGRVWVNQNWLADIVFYLIYNYVGQWGLLVFKLVLFLGCCVLISAAFVKKGVPLKTALPVLAFGMLCFISYAFLRPNLIAITILLPLLFFCLYYSRNRPGFIWIAAILTALWANTHGSYILAIFALFLWAGVHGLDLILRKPGMNLRHWLLFYAFPAFAALVGTIIFNPYHLDNLTFSFAAFGDKVWSTNINEWKPVWYDDFSGFSTALAIFVLIFIAAVIIRALTAYHIGVTKSMDKEELFEIIFAMILMIMAMVSRRLIPYAVIAAVFPLAAYYKRLYGYLKLKGVNTALCVVILIISVSTARYNYYQYYAPDNVYGNRGTFFERMQFINSYLPVEAAEFLLDNRIEGNMLCHWKWEGYLRLKCPDIKVYTGARAQQIYDSATYRNYLGLTGDNPDIKLLSQNKIDMIALPCNESNFGVLIKKVLSNGWMPVYADSSVLIIVDTAIERNKTLVQKVKAGDVQYGPESGKLTPYAMLLSVSGEDGQKRIFSELTGLSEEYNTPWIYYGLSPILLGDDEADAVRTEDFYKAKLDFFLKVAGNNSEGRKIYFCAGEMLFALMEYYKSTGRQEDLIKLTKYLQIEKAIGVQFN